MSFFGVLGMAGLYARQAVKTGWLGLVGYLLLSLWFVLIMGFSFVEAFVLPRVATTSPAFVQGWMGMFVGPATKIDLGALPTLWTLSGPIYIIGGLLFGIATFRAGILPRWAGACLPPGRYWLPWRSCFPTRRSRRSRSRWGWPWPGWDMHSGLNSERSPLRRRRLPHIQRRRKWCLRRAPARPSQDCRDPILTEGLWGGKDRADGGHMVTATRYPSQHVDASV